MGLQWAILNSDYIDHIALARLRLDLEVISRFCCIATVLEILKNYVKQALITYVWAICTQGQAQCQEPQQATPRFVKRLLTPIQS